MLGCRLTAVSNLPKKGSSSNDYEGVGYPLQSGNHLTRAWGQAFRIPTEARGRAQASVGMSCQPIARYEREMFSAGCNMNIGSKNCCVRSHRLFAEHRCAQQLQNRAATGPESFLSGSLPPGHARIAITPDTVHLVHGAAIVGLASAKRQATLSINSSSREKILLTAQVA